jgi:hypothetical protein
MRAVAAACKNGGLDREVKGRYTETRCLGVSNRAIEKRIHVAKNTTIGFCLLQRTSEHVHESSRVFMIHSAQVGKYLNLGDVAAHDTAQDARSQLPRRPRAHIQAGRCVRQSVACRHRKADRSALQLSRPQRDARVAAGKRRQLEREGMTAGQMQARCGGGDDVERRVDLRALVERNNHGGPAEEAIAIF